MEKDLRQLLSRYNISFKKAFGQNFLFDSELLADIVQKAGINKDDSVIEIGCGAGTLTRELARQSKKVIGYEIDLSLKTLLTEVLSEFDNTEIIYKDIMKESVTDIEKKVGGNYKVVANLPYYITTPVIMKFIENAEKLQSMSIMVQEEVAMRLTAKPATADYGAITVGINLRGKAEIIKRVPKEMFTPQPKVDSAFVKIEIDKEKFKGVDFVAVRDAVRVGFSNRRKMLINNIMKSYGINRGCAEEILTMSNISLTARGETLDEKSYILLADNIKKCIGSIEGKSGENNAR